MGLSVSYVEKELQAVRFRAHMEAIQVGQAWRLRGLRVQGRCCKEGLCRRRNCAASAVLVESYRREVFSGLDRPAFAWRDQLEVSNHVVVINSQVFRVATRAFGNLRHLCMSPMSQQWYMHPLQEAILQLTRCDWVRPLLDLLESHARKAPGLTHGQKVVADHLFNIILNKVSCHCPDNCRLCLP